MGMIIKSNQEAWSTLSNKVNTRLRDAVTYLETAYDEAQRAVSIAERASEIGSLNLFVTKDELELLGENRRRLRSFAQGVHYEISVRVDNRFSVQMSNTVDRAYSLRPEDIRVRTSGHWFWAQTSSLSGLLIAKITDKELRNDFLARVIRLNHREKSIELQQSILEAEFWQNEYVMAREIQKITEQIFTDEVRELWSDKSPEERILYMERLIDESMAVLFADMPFNRTGELVFKRWNTETEEYQYISGNGMMRRGQGVGTNIDQIGLNPNFRDLATGNFSVDMMIRVTVHEVRHAYQWEVRHWIQLDEETRGPNPFPHIPYSVMNDWGREYIRHNRLQGPRNNFMEYYLQPVEIDANAFAGLARPRESSIEGQ